jgi:hypothetical protein
LDGVIKAQRNHIADALVRAMSVVVPFNGGQRPAQVRLTG